MVATITVAERGAEAAGSIHYYYGFGGFEDCTNCWSRCNSGNFSGIHDLPEVAIQQIVVPVVDDYVEWHCKAILVRNDHAPHSAVASADPRADAAASGCF